MSVVNLSERRNSVNYTIRISHRWDGSVEVFVEDVADDQRSRESVGWALCKAASAWRESNMSIHKSARYDPRCLDLAEMFLSDEPHLASRASELADHIQAAVEDWIRSERCTDCDTPDTCADLGCIDPRKRENPAGECCTALQPITHASTKLASDG